MINRKQVELAQQLSNQILEHYPDVEVSSIRESGVYPDHLWIEIVVPINYQENMSYDEYDVLKFASNLALDILVTYGYHISAIVGTKKINNQINGLKSNFAAVHS